MADVHQDRAEIFDLFNLYADALDYKRWDMLQELFTEDVTTDWFGVYQVNGRKEVIAYISELVGKVGNTHHILGNYTAKINGDTAEASARVRAYHVGAGDKAHLFEESLAAFEAKLIRTKEGWRFSHFAEPLYVMLGTQEVFGLEDPQ
ncbi:SnoaL-like protein [Cohnella sp. SGD-V74]|uniref:nuclear transport factor 2 family protein n=1 Tax=unclassified Cohnella TaxID=2636738 RepID=UPI000D426EBB|nr:MULTISPECIES: nuclear transport factor 2 family protein [unclassified Cohnella]PRX64585.1 SnoaL-like protein [Cohnella sp. SGD-V74]